MRLLCTDTLEISDAPDDSVPPYAILSHTWGKDEMTFQDLRALAHHGARSEQHVRNKAGFAKVRDAAALAKSRNLSRIWIDTCCIDKTSSAELSEAINSMYRWYAGARECYAYLSDVEGGSRGADEDEGEGEGEDEEKIAGRFARSRWFTRGWTLQELIAPQSVLFYDKHWVPLGSKSGSKAMLVALERITGVDKGVLGGHMQPGDLSIASRMQWAADRRTTRHEDLAYCLMGIFDVNMPLLYGEGHRAFTRLQEEILRVTDDQSIFAWATLDPKHGSSEEICGLLATHPKHFKNVRSMNPLPPLLGRESVPSSFTNQGLRVQLQLRPVAEVEGMAGVDPVAEEYIAILDCSVTTGFSHFWPALHLQRLWNDQFARIRPNVCRYLPAPAVAGSAYQTIFVKQKPKHVIPELFVPTMATGDESMFMDLVDVFPTARWNPHSMTLKSVYSSGNGVMGAFRFRHKGTADDEVDVLVGIRPSEFQLKTRQVTWEAWCFQRRCDGRSLRHVVDQWNRVLLESEGPRPSLVEYQSRYGEDQRLLSSASVVELMMYSRLFFSVQVEKRCELAIDVELAPSDSSLFSTDEVVEGPSIKELSAELVAPCFTSAFFGQEKTRLEKGVRTRERYNSNWLALVSGLKAHPTMVADPPSGKRKTGDWVRFTRSLASGSMSMEPWNSKLLDACRRGDHDKVKELIRRGASVNCCTQNTQFKPWGFKMEGMTPLHWAIVAKSDSIITELMHEGANIMAASSGRWNVLHFLAVLYDANEPLPKAIVEKLDSLSEDNLVSLTGAKVSDVLETPLHIVCGRLDGNKQLFDFLVRKELGLRGSRNKMGEFPIHRAAASGNVHAISFYAENSAPEDVLDMQDEELRTPVWHAAGARPGTSTPNSPNAVEPLVRLLAAGASANLADNLGRSPLHIACREGFKEAVDVLLTYGAFVASPTAHMSLTPYHFAALFQSEGCLQTLLERRPPAYREFDNPAHGSGCFFTPLHIAAANGWQSGVMTLVAAGADPEASCTHYIRKGRATAAITHATVDDTNNGSTLTPELIEISASSVFDLVEGILRTHQHDFWEEEPLLKHVQQFLERVPRNGGSAAAAPRPRAETGTTMTATTMDTVDKDGAGKGNRSRKPTVDGQQGAVVDLSSYDGGIALDLPTPGFSPDAKLEFGNFS